MRFRLLVLGMLIASILLVSCSDCPEGKIPGACGLSGECVECNTDHDCLYGIGNTCLSDGTCVEAYPCRDNYSCAGSLICADDGACSKPCENHEECNETERCNVYGSNGGYCYKERCNAEGKCPNGWESVKGSLNCHYSG